MFNIAKKDVTSRYLYIQKMKHREIVIQIRHVYSSHIRWRSAIQAMHMGFPEFEKNIETDPHKTEFGNWYFGDWIILSNYDNFKQLGELNEKLHAIHQLILNKEKEYQAKKFYSKLNIQEYKLHKNLILGYLRDFADLSKELLHHLKSLEQLVISENIRQ